MKTYIPKFLRLILAVVAALMQSCTDHIEQPAMAPIAQKDISVVNGKLSFKSKQSFFETISKINEMSPSELSAWQQNFKFTSLLNSVDTAASSQSLKQLPIGYRAVLNRNGEAIFGDTIVWYSATGTKHYIPKLNEELLTKIKTGAVESKLKGTFTIKTASILNKKENPEGRFIWVTPGDKDHEARWQHEFCYHNDCGSRRKYIHELYMVVDDWYYTLYLVAKLEWRGRRGWYGAGEDRYIIMNLACTVQLTAGDKGIYGATYVPIHVNTVYHDNLNIFIAQDFLTYSNYAYWDIDIRGEILQEIVDDPNSRWDNVSYPLW
ncbi:hypothetical protein [Chryseolinea lacunae]|uniref:DUF4861 domain-containing protein n=1 Tax=Chryseolinea lacunae TaxID=2801331 RepID=A0ABS1KNZ8_9BACT|nr:hypothetical protein [Chryseolinea lacunae]MBL0740987.1 hypothetical protein [Chryseolinea lacunae]